MTNATNSISQQAVLLTPEDHLTFNGLMTSFLEELEPLGPIENSLCTQIILAAWNLERANRLEVALATANSSDPLLATETKTLDRIATFRVRAERTFHKSLKELQAYQSAQSPHKQNEAKSKMQNKPNLQKLNSKPLQTTATQQADRDELCPCHSGQKFKNCCLRNEPNRAKTPVAEIARSCSRAL